MSEQQESSLTATGAPAPLPRRNPTLGLPVRWVGGWTAPILVVVFTILWNMLIYWLIGDRPRVWQYGTLQYVPGVSIVSAEQASTGRVPPQVEYPPGGAHAQ